MCSISPLHLYVQKRWYLTASQLQSHTTWRLPCPQTSCWISTILYIDVHGKWKPLHTNTWQEQTGCSQNINFQMFTDGVHFPYDNVYTRTSSNLNPFAMQPQHKMTVYQHYSVFHFSPYTCIYRIVGIRQPVSSTVIITGKTAVSRTTWQRHLQT